MRVLKTLLAVAVIACCAQTVRAQWPDTTGTSNGRFWMEANAKFLDRPGSQLGLPLITNDVTREVLLTSDQITDLNTDAGAEVRFGSHSKLLGIDWEIGGQFGGWDSTYSFDGPDLVSPFFPDLDPGNVGINYTSDFSSLELSWRKAVVPGLTFTTGPRYFRMVEEMVSTTRTTFDTVLGPVDLDTNNTVTARNSAVGWQLGLEYNQPVTRDVYLQGFVRTSGLLNAARVTRSDVTSITDLTSETRDKDTGMFIGTTGGRIYFSILPRNLYSYAGYEATWIDGVAIAPTQLLFTSGPESLPTSNTIFWHAITFGLRFTY